MSTPFIPHRPSHNKDEQPARSTFKGGQYWTPIPLTRGQSCTPNHTPADGGVGGLVARNPIESAVLLLLFTDARADPDDLRYEHRGDRRGWVGDGFDIDTANGEAPLGSFLWLLRRSILNTKVFGNLKAEAQRALSPLITQGVAVSIDVDGELDQVNNRVSLTIDIAGRKGRKVYAQKFDILWKRADGL